MGVKVWTGKAEPVQLFDFEKVSGLRGDLSEFSPSMTRQEFAEECDINVIMAHYEATGAVSHVNRAEPVYLDTTEYPGLQASMDLFREAASAFNALPAKVRREFDNDAQQFVDFACDPGNVERMREWGLAEPVKAAEAPIRVEMVNPPADKPAVSTAAPAAGGTLVP